MLTLTTSVYNISLHNVAQRDLSNLFSKYPQLLLTCSSYRRGVRTINDSKPTSKHLLLEKFVIVCVFLKINFIMKLCFVCIFHCCLVIISHPNMSSTILSEVQRYSLYFSFASSKACLFIQ